MTLLIKDSESHLAEECFLGYMIPSYNNMYHECLMTDSNTLTKDEEIEAPSRI